MVCIQAFISRLDSAVLLRLIWLKDTEQVMLFNADLVTELLNDLFKFHDSLDLFSVESLSRPRHGFLLI